MQRIEPDIRPKCLAITPRKRNERVAILQWAHIDSAMQ
jgi:hypothetical protein